ncbi:MAG: CDGSH iron-sulfur domain-containing protein [Methyloligellaceae bacterium]
MAEDPIPAQLSPYMVEVEEGKRYAWCRCGRSKNQPFCDGSHQGTELQPLLFTAEKTETIPLCGCKNTNDAPFCDGTHNIL